MNNKIENHLGFTINRLEIGEEPDPAFLELARVWLGMSEKKRRLTAQTGSWGNMPSFWYEEVLSDETMIAMTAVLKAEGFKKVF